MMAVGEVRVMPCLFVLTRFVVFCGFFVMTRRVFMVFRGLGVMLRCLL
jgi:hypothetical protein